jgi:hypothetical protein
MPAKFHVGDRVEDKETHKRGRVTFVYSERTRLSPKSHARLATPKTPTTRGSRPQKLEGPRR